MINQSLSKAVEDSVNNLIRSVIELNYSDSNDCKQVKSFAVDSTFILRDSSHLRVPLITNNQEYENFKIPLSDVDCSKLIQYCDEDDKLLVQKINTNQTKPYSSIRQMISKDYNHKLPSAKRHFFKFSFYNSVNDKSNKCQLLDLISSANNPQLESLRQSLAPQAVQIFASIYKLVIEGADTNHSMIQPTLANTANNIYPLLTYNVDDHASYHTNYRSRLYTRCFGSLLISLPTETGYVGGESILFCGKGDENSFQFHKDAIGINDHNVTAELLAFGLGCTYSLKPITSGYRVALMYNLFWDIPEECKENVTIGSLQTCLESILMEDLPRDIIKTITDYAMFDPIMSIILNPEFDNQNTYYFLYALDYLYTEPNLTMSDLQGRDKLILNQLCNFISIDRLDLVFCTFTVSGSYPKAEDWQAAEYVKYRVSNNIRIHCKCSYIPNNDDEVDEKEIRRVTLVPNEFSAHSGRSIIMITDYPVSSASESWIIRPWRDTELLLISETYSERPIGSDEEDETHSKQHFQVKYKGVALRINVKGFKKNPKPKTVIKKR